MSFFRRKKREAEAPAKRSPGSSSPPAKDGASTLPSPKPLDEETDSPSTSAGAPLLPEPARTPSPPAIAAPAAPVAVRGPTTPPPLPDPAPKLDGPAPIVPHPKSYCFVCGAALDEGRCPTCRMTWVE